MNLYNVLITYSGEGAFKFYISGIGEVEITSWRPIFLYNASVQVINDLRLLKRSLISIKINGSPDGAYKVFDLLNIRSKVDRKSEVVSQEPNLEEIKNELRNEIKEDIRKEVEAELNKDADILPKTNTVNKKSSKSKKTK